MCPAQIQPRKRANIFLKTESKSSATAIETIALNISRNFNYLTIANCRKLYRQKGCIARFCPQKMHFKNAVAENWLTQILGEDEIISIKKERFGRDRERCERCTGENLNSSQSSSCCRSQLLLLNDNQTKWTIHTFVCCCL